MEEACNSAANKEMKSEGDEGVELEKSNNKGGSCCSPQSVRCKEKEGLHGGREVWVFLVIIYIIL